MFNPEIYIQFSAPCSECNKGGTGVHVRFFKSEMFNITETSRNIFLDKGDGYNKCWKCKKAPEVGEIWGLTVSHKKRNRIFCPECSEFIGKRIAEITKKSHLN